MARTTLLGLAATVAACTFATTAASRQPPARAGTQGGTHAAAKPRAGSKPLAAPAKPHAKGAPGGGAKSAAPPPPAEVPDCPPGAVCEREEVEPPPEASRPGATAAAEAEPASPAGETTVVLPPPPPGADPAAPRTFTYVPDPQGGPGQLILYGPETPPPTEAVEPPPPPPPPPKKRRWHRNRRWGVNARIEGAILPRMGRGDRDVGMGGLGVSLRYRPIRHFGLDLGVDFLGGHDANGLERQEVPISASALFYVNPRSLAQFYFLGGVNWSFAQVYSDTPLPNLANSTDDHYNYIGGHAGMGLEFRVVPLLGIDIDGLAFLRTRTDDDGGGLYPEYLDQRSGQTSNASAAGLLRAGVTLWW